MSKSNDKTPQWTTTVIFHITQLHISHFRSSICKHIILLFSFHIIIKIIRLLLGSTTRHVQLILIQNITIMRRISFIVILSITFFQMDLLYHSKYCKRCLKSKIKRNGKADHFSYPQSSL